MVICEAYIVGEAENVYQNHYGIYDTLEEAIKMRSVRQLEYPRKKIVIEEFNTILGVKNGLFKKARDK